jgi:hypothetical protein
VTNVQRPSRSILTSVVICVIVMAAKPKDADLSYFSPTPIPTLWNYWCQECRVYRGVGGRTRPRRKVRCKQGHVMTSFPPE